MTVMMAAALAAEICAKICSAHSVIQPEAVTAARVMVVAPVVAPDLMAPVPTEQVPEPD